MQRPGVLFTNLSSTKDNLSTFEKFLEVEKFLSLSIDTA